MLLAHETLDKNREKLDVAAGDEVLKLQGENRLLKRILQLKVSKEAKYAKQDGGYGV
jgi:hypothetical protein